MVKMEIMRRRRSVPAWINCKVLMPTSLTALADKDLQGFRSHVRYSVFKDRRHVERSPRCEKRTGNLA